MPNILIPLNARVLILGNSTSNIMILFERRNRLFL